MSRTTDRIQEYQDRRAMALDHQEHIHDAAIEKRLRKQAEAKPNGYFATLTRKALTDFAIREADRNTQ